MKRNKSEFQKWASYTRWSTYTYYFSIWKTVNDRVPPKYKLSMTNFQYESAVQNWLCQQAVIFPFQWIKFIYFSVSLHLFFLSKRPPLPLSAHTKFSSTPSNFTMTKPPNVFKYIIWLRYAFIAIRSPVDLQLLESNQTDLWKHTEVLSNLYIYWE